MCQKNLKSYGPWPDHGPLNSVQASPHTGMYICTSIVWRCTQAKTYLTHQNNLAFKERGLVTPINIAQAVSYLPEAEAY